MVEIPLYQIHNVLKVYSKQISQGRSIGRQKPTAPRASMDKINISAEGKRQAIVDRVASDIVTRITQTGPQEAMDHEVLKKLNQELDAEERFVFNEIDAKNQKKTNRLSLNDSETILQRLETLAKETVDKNLET
ncbi:MAG: hypothetical protein CSA22_08390 [Deltaproteobacteria bacterium]|nr:MAG: hypothetical protein CSA22_08390 [Deltaproteobacteria bacterium]